MNASERPIGRRVFLVELGHGAIAATVVGLAACTPAGSPSLSPGAVSPTGGPSPAPAASDGMAPDSPVAAEPSGGDASALQWARVDLGFVSAYVLARGGEAAIVDTGVEGSEGDIAAVLGTLGLAWDAVGHVILTHRHRDHAGGAAAVMEAASQAIGYAGQADIEGISAPRPLTAVGDGDRIFDLSIVATPGHTPGHIAVLDDVAGVLLAGDALNVSGGKVEGPSAQFSADMTEAEASVRKLAGYAFETLLVGHGEPITSGASELVKALAGA